MRFFRQYPAQPLHEREIFDRISIVDALGYEDHILGVPANKGRRELFLGLMESSFARARRALRSGNEKEMVAFRDLGFRCHSKALTGEPSSVDTPSSQQLRKAIRELGTPEHFPLLDVEKQIMATAFDSAFDDVQPGDAAIQPTETAVDVFEITDTSGDPIFDKFAEGLSVASPLPSTSNVESAVLRYLRLRKQTEKYRFSLPMKRTDAVRAVLSETWTDGMRGYVAELVDENTINIKPLTSAGPLSPGGVVVLKEAGPGKTLLTLEIPTTWRGGDVGTALGNPFLPCMPMLKLGYRSLLKDVWIASMKTSQAPELAL